MSIYDLDNSFTPSVPIRTFGGSFDTWTRSSQQRNGFSSQPCAYLRLLESQDTQGPFLFVWSCTEFRLIVSFFLRYPFITCLLEFLVSNQTWVSRGEIWLLTPSPVFRLSTILSCENFPESSLGMRNWLWERAPHTPREPVVANFSSQQVEAAEL